MCIVICVVVGVDLKIQIFVDWVCQDNFGVQIVVVIVIIILVV